MIAMRSGTVRTSFTLAVGCLFMLLVTGAGAAASGAELVSGGQSWVGAREEPPLLSVRGSLSDPERVVVRFLIGEKVQQLIGHDAQVFMSSRDYIKFDRTLNRWVITDKYRQWKARASTWEGTWAVRSHHLTGRAKGDRIPSEFRVTLKGGACRVVWDSKPVACTVSGNRLECRGEHEHGGAMRWVFVREGVGIIPGQSRFEGTIGGQPASGTFEGVKIDQ